MKRTLMALLVVGTLGSLVVLAPAGKRTVSFVPVAHEQDQNDGCSLASLQGTYALEREGTIVAQLPGFPAPPAPLSEVLIATFNGAGSFSGITTANVGGVVLNSAPFTGTQTVNLNCTGTDTVFTSVGVTLHNSIVVIGGGERFISTETDPFAVVQARGQRLSN